MSFYKDLIALQKYCYIPYSNYPVACIVKNEKGETFKGVNVENASYPLTTCAERVAIANAITNGSKKIIEAHILCSDSKTFGVPCGSCRQVLAEFMDDDGQVFLYNNLGEFKEYKLGELLPHCFRQKYLMEK